MWHWLATTSTSYLTPFLNPYPLPTTKSSGLLQLHNPVPSLRISPPNFNHNHALPTAFVFPFTSKPLHDWRSQLTAPCSRGVRLHLQKSAVNIRAAIADWTWPLRRGIFSTWGMLPRVFRGEGHYYGVLRPCSEIRSQRLEQRVCAASYTRFTRRCNSTWKQRKIY